MCPLPRSTILARGPEPAVFLCSVLGQLEDILGVLEVGDDRLKIRLDKVAAAVAECLNL
jgi:hypothetical protein